MTVSLPPEQEAGFDPDAERKARAHLLVWHWAFQALWNATEGKRTLELLPPDAPALPLGFVRRMLLDCEYLMLRGRRWDFRWRQEATAPLGGLVTTLLTLKGVPLYPEEMAALLAPWRNQPPNILEETLFPFLSARLGQTFFATEEGAFGLLDWVPQVEGLTVEEAITQEFWQQEAFAQWLLSLPCADEPAEGAIALLDAAAMPLSYREVLFALWVRREGDLDLVATLAQLSKDPHLHSLALGYWVNPKGKEATLQTLQAMAEEWQQTTLQKARQKDIRRILQLPPSEKEPVVLLDADVLEEVVQWLAEQPHPVPIPRIAEQVLEVTPAESDFVPTVRALVTLMSQDERLAPFGEFCWWVQDKTPAEVMEVPSVLLPPAPSEQGDVLLPVEALEEDLRRFVEDCRYEEVGEPEAPVPSDLPVPKRLDLFVLYPHLQAGTLKIRRIDLPFFPPEPPVQFLLAIDDTRTEVGLWVNLSLGLCFGLAEWYQRRKVGVGGIVRLERTKGDIIRLSWTGRYDPLLRISPSRLEQLQQFATHETIRQAPLLTLVQALLPQHPNGAHFLQLWSELNVLRRTTKRALASLLSAYPMFTRVPHMDGFWTIDFSKMAEGIRPEKAHYLAAGG